MNMCFWGGRAWPHRHHPQTPRHHPPATHCHRPTAPGLPLHAEHPRTLQRFCAPGKCQPPGVEPDEPEVASRPTDLFGAVQQTQGAHPKTVLLQINTVLLEPQWSLTFLGTEHGTASRSLPLLLLIPHSAVLFRPSSVAPQEHAGKPGGVVSPLHLLVSDSVDWHCALSVLPQYCMGQG